MELKTTEQRYREFLDTLPLSTLRILGRHFGVAAASSSNKRALIDEIIAILTGKVQPAPRSNRGAPVKQTYVDPSILERLSEIRLRGDEDVRQRNFIFEVAAPEDDFGRVSYDDPVYTGILEITPGGYGFVRARNCQPSANGEDVFLPAPFIHSMELRAGDLIACTAQPRQRNEAAAIVELLSVNGLPQGKYNNRPIFESLTAVYPTEKIGLSDQNNDFTLRMLDLFVPIGKGQRALITAPPKTGKTTLLKTVARAIAESHRELVLLVLLIDERPEEVTDLRSAVPDATVIYSTFDEGADHHVRAAKLTLEHAKRLVEHGKDVVILLDSLTKLTRAYNYLTESSGKTLSGGLDATALAEPKRFFGAARRTREAGSLTILATALVETGSRMDDVIYEEFKGTGNADVILSREFAERRIFPAIDLRRSGTRKEELLLSEAELQGTRELREHRMTETSAILSMMRRTMDNKELIARLSEWLRSDS